MPNPSPMAAAPEVWQAVLSDLSARLRREQIETWFRRVVPIEFDGSALSVAVPPEFHRNWIVENYLDSLGKSCRAVLGSGVNIRIVVDPERAAISASADAPRAHVTVIPTRTGGSAAASSPVGEVSTVPAQPASSTSSTSSSASSSAPTLSLNPSYTFENFVVGPCNRFAYAGAMGVAENPSNAYNPLFLHGSVGLRKTHLLQAICREMLRKRPSAKILYLSCETFTNHFIAALERGALEEFRRRYRGVDILLVDDVHFLANKERTQEEFFHTFNSLFHEHKQIVLSSAGPPADIPTLQDRLVCRFKWGLEAEIERPCLETRLAILRRKARTMNVALTDEVAHFLAERITKNIRELEGAINRVAGYASLQRETISIALVRHAMPELDAERITVVRFEDVANVVARRYGVKILDLQSRRRHQSVAFPRQIAMFLTRRHTKHSLEEIGAYFGR